MDYISTDPPKALRAYRLYTVLERMAQIATTLIAKDNDGSAAVHPA